MDAFYAAVEQRDDPSLRGKPVAVGGGGKRGVVASASYEARKYKVRSAMPGFKAAQLCPHIHFVKPNFEKYKAISNQIRDIFYEYTDLVEPLSLDEAYLDVTHTKIGPPSGTLIANEIRAKIKKETELTASAGISYCKFLAKIASDINKPNGYKVILPHEAESFLEQLPIQKFYGIGKVTAKKMNAMNIFTGLDLKRYSKIQMIKLFGKPGRFYYDIIRGDDNRPVNPNSERKSIGAERTFGENLQTIEEMMEQVERIAAILLKAINRTQNPGRTLTLKIRDGEFQTFTRSKTHPYYLTTKEALVKTSKKLLLDNQEILNEVRLLGISLSNLQKETNSSDQLQFEFEEE